MAPDEMRFSARQEEPEPVRPDIGEAIGQSDSFLYFQERLSKVAQVDRPVLLMGERGTGKELAAQRLHYLSKRWDGPLVTLNCAALSSTLIESELFGHEAGAYTGAGSRRQGRFETADGGTLILDEIGNIPIEVQAKILRVVEYHTFERVGSSQAIEVDVRIIGATNADLQAKADKGQFMRDLLDRLSFDVLVLPPLRERKEDIGILANHFAARMGYELNWEDVPEITEEAMETLEQHPWDGNIRELKNVIERAVYRSDDHIITREELIFDPFREYGPLLRETAVKQATQDGGGGGPDLDAGEENHSAAPTPGAMEKELQRGFNESIREMEKRLLKQALEQAKFNQRKAAETLGLSYHQFRGVYRKYQDELAI
ncbi:MAG: phage shock protein operon transcriptional activator [Candidatus Hydrogenedentales bacterium]